MKLARLSKPATLNEYVQPIALPTNCSVSDRICSTTGWGDTMSLISGGMFSNDRIYTESFIYLADKHNDKVSDKTI